MKLFLWQKFSASSVAPYLTLKPLARTTPGLPNTFPMAKNSVLILGAGELGEAIIDSLASDVQIQKDFDIKVLLRPSTINSKDATKIALRSFLTQRNVEIVSGDLVENTKTTLASIFKSFTMVVGSSGMTYPPGTQLKISEAVLEAGVKHYIPWQYGVDYDIIGRSSSQTLFTEQLDVRGLLRNQTNTKWIIISVGMFMSFLFEESFGVVDSQGNVRALGGWDNKVTVTRVEDIALVVSEVLKAWNLQQNIGDDQGVIYVAGETLTYGRLADIVEKIKGRSIGRQVWDIESLKKELTEDPNNGMKRYRPVFAEGRGIFWDEGTTFNRKIGLNLMGVEEYLSARKRS